MRWAVVAMLFAGAPAWAQQSTHPSVQRGWAAYVTVAANLCGQRDQQWAEQAQRGLVTDAIRGPEAWGIPRRRVMWTDVPDANAFDQAVGGIAMAMRLGELLHARMPAQVCAEARRVTGTLSEVVRTANPANTVPALDPKVLDTGALLFTANLAADVCRIRRGPWLADAAPHILAMDADVPTPGADEPTERRRTLARRNGASRLAGEAPRIAHRVYGAALCRSLATWPELRQADAAAEQGRQERTRPGGVWRDLRPVD